MSRQHELKCHPGPFAALARGVKTFEIRNNDRAFELGDELFLCEWNEVTGYSGRALRALVAYVLDLREVPDLYLAPDGKDWVAIGLVHLAPARRQAT